MCTFRRLMSEKKDERVRRQTTSHSYLGRRVPQLYLTARCQPTNHNHICFGVCVAFFLLLTQTLPTHKTYIGVVVCASFLPGFDRTLQTIFTYSSACVLPSLVRSAPPLRKHSHFGWRVRRLPLTAIYHTTNYTFICVGLCVAFFIPLTSNLRISLPIALNHP